MKKITQENDVEKWKFYSIINFSAFWKQHTSIIIICRAEKVLSLDRCSVSCFYSFVFQIKTCRTEKIIYNCIKAIDAKVQASIYVDIRECHLFSWYLESSFSKWISMQNFIMNVPQTLILFKIASVILAVQK